MQRSSHVEVSLIVVLSIQTSCSGDVVLEEAQVQAAARALGLVQSPPVKICALQCLRSIDVASGAPQMMVPTKRF